MIRLLHCFMLLLSALFLAGCANHYQRDTEYTRHGEVSYKSVQHNGEVVSELRRTFDGTVVEGNGIFENANEGLARRAATQLAVAELAGQVQTRVRAETTIYNNQDVRDVVENRVHALVNNYRLDSAGYDPGTNKYRVRVSITGETLAREIERRIN